jgi:hypothetical protein
VDVLNLQGTHVYVHRIPSGMLLSANVRQLSDLDAQHSIHLFTQPPASVAAVRQLIAHGQIMFVFQKQVNNYQVHVFVLAKLS